jgi:hypothetical protein
MASVLWSETPDESREETERPDSAEVDESFAQRRLRRWIKGMFGGKPKEDDDRGNDEAPPTGDV